MDLEPIKPNLEYLCRAYIEVATPTVIEKTPLGERRIIPFTGKLVGEKLSGDVLPGGVDCQLVRPDGTVLVEARYAIRTPDGAYVYIHNYGRRSGPPEVLKQTLARGAIADPASYYFRLTPEFETGSPNYFWLNDVVGVCSAARTHSAVLIDFYIVR
jgi:hypothetical protein